ncbi:putative ATP-dependent RNA helicase DDX20 isoform X1 [Ixodes scapularis]
MQTRHRAAADQGETGEGPDPTSMDLMARVANLCDTVAQRLVLADHGPQGQGPRPQVPVPLYTGYDDRKSVADFLAELAAYKLATGASDEARSLSERLNRSLGGVQLLSGAQGQEERMAALARLKGFRCRLLVSTDLAARGIDAERVNLVVNFDLPWDLETHLHRSGRAGRYGSAGDAVTLVSGAGELEQLQVLCRPIGLLLRPLPATAWSPQSGSAEQNNIANSSGTGNIAEHACEAIQKPLGERAAQPPQPALRPQLGSVLRDKKAHLGTDLAWPPNRTLCTALWRLVLADRDAFLNTGAVGEAVGPQDAENLLEEGDLLEKDSSRGGGGPPNEDGHQDRRDCQRKQAFLQEGGFENEYGIQRRDSSCKGHGLQRKCGLQEEPSPHRKDTCSQKLCSPLQWPCAVGTFGWPWLWEHSHYMQRMLRPLGDGSNHC